MIFYEHAQSLNLPRFVKSFLPQDVASIMRSSSNDWRVLVYASDSGFDIFVWTALLLHSAVSKALDSNKGLNKYPGTLKYNFLYNESQLLMKGDTVGKLWCFPFVIWKNEIIVNLIPDALSVLQGAKNVKGQFNLSDKQWKGLMENQKCSI